MRATDPKDLAGRLRLLEGYLRGTGYSGFDPYDALASPLVRAATLGRKSLRILATQAMKRLPVNLRPLLGVPPGHNPKGLGLFLWGYAKLFSVEGREEHLDRVSLLLDLLEGTRSVGYSGNCWGYNFDWQSRAFFLPRNTPTIVNSGFIGHALLDAHLATGSARALAMATPIADFIVKDLNRIKYRDSFCFSYSPLDKYAVHNANLIGASLLIRLYRYTEKPSHRDDALESLAYSMSFQREDGSWYYAEGPGSRWIDSFHTGFVLQALWHFFQEGHGQEYMSNFDRGVEFYVNNFFLDDGTPKYYHDRIYPIDVHCPAQAIVLFSRLGGKYHDLAAREASWMVRNLQDASGYFYFQINRIFKNKIPYIRWGQAWAFHALTDFLFYIRRTDGC